MRTTHHRTQQKQEISDFSVSKSNIHEAGTTTYDPIKAERALWSAVITQALMDAGSASKKPEAQHEKAKAIRWLLGNSEDFITVCQNADLDPHYVREKAKAAIDRGCIWRRGMTEKRIPGTHAFTLERKHQLPTSLTRPSRQPAPRPSLMRGNATFVMPQPASLLSNHR